MAGSLHRALLVSALGFGAFGFWALGSCPAVAEPSPAVSTTPPSPHRAEHRPAHPTPVVRPKAGPAVRKVAPAAPAVVPAPVVPPAPAADKDAEPSKGSNTGNPLPRFASLRTDEVNLRSGPGTRYPIEWVYKRRDLPVVIEREFEVWRLVRDLDGTKGWVHQATLAPRRSGVVTGNAQTLRSDPSDGAGAVAILKPGVIVRLRSCEATSDWCQVSVQDYRGWLKRTQFWGTLPGEAVQ